jgi:hypothetical protein
MKSVLLSLIILLFTSVGAQIVKGQDSFLLSKNKAGGIEIGMTIDALHTKYEPRLTKLTAQYPEGMFSPLLEIYLNGKLQNVEPSITVAIDKENAWIVGGIRVKDKRFKTSKGIGIGSTLGEIRKTYKVSWIDFGEGSLFANVEDLGISFEIDFSKLSDEWYRTRNQSLIPDSARVVSINVYNAR